MPFSPSFSLPSVDGTNGFQIDGQGLLYGLGRAISFIGDINGDGIDDIAIGSPGAGIAPENESGWTYVIFGRRDPWPANFSLAALDGTNGFKVKWSGTAQIAQGEAVAAAGDVNGDGVDDLLVSAFQSAAGGQTQSGSAFVIYGKISGWGAEFDLAGINGTNGFRVDGAGTGDFLGFTLSGAGDVNGDGFDDVVLGARYVDRFETPNAGAAYVVFGATSGIPAVRSVTDLNGTNGFRFEGEDLLDQAGSDVAIVGDVNGDGFDDLLIAAAQADPVFAGLPGELYLVFGKASGWPTAFAPGDLTGSNGVRITTDWPSSLISATVKAAGDVNGDGIADMIIGTQAAGVGTESGRGGAYVVFGKTGTWAADFNLASLNGANGFQITGLAVNDYAGASVSGAGDVNGDGFDDIVVGAPGVDPNGQSDCGAAYVIYGKASGWASSLSVSTLNGANGFQLVGAAADDAAGLSVSLSGDLNGDGFADVAVGAPGRDGGFSNAGGAYVVFGEPTGAVSRSGTPQTDWLYGGAFADTIQGLAGSDRLFGRDGADVLYGGAGPDTLDGGAGDDFLLPGDGADAVLGGAGFDAVYYGDSAVAVSINLQTAVHGGFAAGDTFTSVEALLLTGQGDAFTGRDDASSGDIVYGLDGADSLRGLDGFDYLLGGDGDDTLEGGLGWDLSTGGAGADRFVFRTGADGGAGPGGGEIITDFQSGTDKLVFLSATTGISALVLGQNLFLQSGGVTGTQGTATGATLIYDQATGGLWFDVNGSVAGGLSWLTGLLGAPTLAGSDFVVV